MYFLVLIVFLTFFENFSGIYHSHREGKFFPFYYSVVRFENSICFGNCKLWGTCYTRKECKKFGGTSSGKCAKGLGVCCVVQKSCGATVHVNNTYFQNPDFPMPYAGGSKCTISISRCDPSVCQLRLDFLSLDLGQPNGEGSCVDDSLMITGGASEAPIICGQNTGQHVYIDFDGKNPIQISVKTNPGMVKSRVWNIKATQIACDSAERAPAGCLQYFTDISGSVKSFNYDSTSNTNKQDNTGLTGTRQMNNLNYGVCVGMAPNFCRIQWSQTSDDLFSFTVSNDTSALENSNILGTAQAELKGENCTHDYVIVPHPFNGDSDLNADRYCGNGFSTKVSFSKPFILYVVTDVDESNGRGPPDVANRGFSLNFQQLPCLN